MSQQTINLREILHDFALTYRVESRETRKQDIDKASTAILKLIGEMVPKEHQQWKNRKEQTLNGAWNSCRQTFLDRLEEIGRGV